MDFRLIAEAGILATCIALIAVLSACCRSSERSKRQAIALVSRATVTLQGASTCIEALTDRCSEHERLWAKLCGTPRLISVGRMLYEMGIDGTRVHPDTPMLMAWLNPRRVAR